MTDRPLRLNQTQLDHLELDSTDVSPTTAKFLSYAFVFVLFLVPVTQALVEVGKSQWPQALNLFEPFATGIRRAAAGNLAGLWSAWRDGIKPETLHAYEAGVENASIFERFFQPRMQQMLTRFLGVGNDKVVLGRDGWIFYQPGLEYVIGPSISDETTFARATQQMVNLGVQASPQPDPRPALLAFDRACRAAGIRLIVVPVPDKVMMQPSQLHWNRADAVAVPNNAGYRRLAEQMRAAGLDWFDPAPDVVRPTEVRYLAQDTHWTPAFMNSVARDLAAHIRDTGVLPQGAPIPMRVVEQRVSRVGDLVDMLQLTPQQSVFAPQTVTVEQVIDERSGQLLQPDPEADLLLLGDSFTNIYTEPAMGWGAAAGFGQHLAFHLKRPIDVIAFNGGGATQVRAELARRDNAARLGYKKVIVYQFAIRNLLGEHWQRVEMTAPEPPAVAAPPQEASAPPRPAPDVPETKARTAGPPPADTRVKADAGRASVPRAGSGLVVVGRIVQTSRVPAPGTAPYRDCLTFIKVSIESVESGSYAQPEMLVVFVAMKDNQWLPAASYGVGDRLRMNVIPFSTADPEIRGMQRADDTEDLTLRPFFVVRERRE